MHWQAPNCDEPEHTSTFQDFAQKVHAIAEGINSSLLLRAVLALVLVLASILLPCGGAVPLSVSLQQVWGPSQKRIDFPSKFGWSQ